MSKKHKKQWEPIIFRPILPSGWSCIEQRSNPKFSDTAYTRTGKRHYKSEPERFWIILYEFNMDYWENEGQSYKYSVRGGNDIKPNSNLRYFAKLKDAENYMIYLMESTNKWIDEINSHEYEKTYEKRIQTTLKSHESIDNY